MNSNELCTFQKRLLIIVIAYRLLLRCSSYMQYRFVCYLFTRDLGWRVVLHQYCNGSSWVLTCSEMEGCAISTISVIRICSVLQDQSNDIGLVFACCIHKCRLTKLIYAINWHSCIQHLFGRADVTITRCSKKAVEKLIINFCRRKN